MKLDINIKKEITETENESKNFFSKGGIKK